METNLYLKRIIYTDLSTIGDLFWQGGEWETSTLEDSCRNRDKNNDNILQKEEKVYGQTAIPAGRYEIKMEWSNHFQRMMPHLQNVPYYTGIMIHWANSPQQILGCIAVGKKEPNLSDWISNSLRAYNDLEPKIKTALEKGQLFINIEGGYSA